MQDENKKSFHQGMKAELKKVIWPTGKQVVKSTFATIGFVLLISIILIALNFVFSFLNTKWFDLIDGYGKQTEQGVTQSGDSLSGESINSGDNQSGEILNSGDNVSSGENDADNTNVDSGE